MEVAVEFSLLRMCECFESERHLPAGLGRAERPAQPAGAGSSALTASLVIPFLAAAAARTV